MELFSQKSYTKTMNVISINKKDRTPLYLQIQQSILLAIQSGELRDQDPLPYEEDVSAFYRISRQVVRQAYNELEKEGYLIRIRRKGTFIQLRPVVQFVRPELLDFKQLLEARGFTYAHRLLLIESVFVKNPAFPYVFNAHYGHALRIVYNITANGQPFALHEIYVPGNLSLPIHLFKESGFDPATLVNLLHLPVETVVMGTLPKISTNIESISLGIKPNSVLAEHSLTYLDEAKKPCLYSKILFDGRSGYVKNEVIY